MPDSQSPLSAALARIGDRWKLLIVDALLSGPLRYSDLQQAVPGISTNVLSDRLKALEQERLVVADPYSERPTRYDYALSASGKELAGALKLLADWGARGSDEVDPPRHRPCDTSLEVRWYCPTCEVWADANPEVWHA